MNKKKKTNRNGQERTHKVENDIDKNFKNDKDKDKDGEREDDKQLSSRVWKSKANRKQNEHLRRWIVRSRVSFLGSKRWERQDGGRRSDMQEKKKKKRH